MAATLGQFMAAISGQESSGDFTAENLHSGAYGQYQIMPYNWPNWAEEAGLGRNAPQTQGNQNIVAAFKMQQYYDQFGNWGDVASTWYSGGPLSSYTDEERTRKQYTDGIEYPSIQEYVDSVLGKVGETGGGAGGGGYDSGMYEQVRRNADEAYQDWLDAGSPGEDAEDEEGYRIWARKQEAVAALNDFQSVYGIDPRATGANDANDRISRWATVEGVDMDKAAAAFTRWKTKHDQAFTAANEEITSAQGQNEERVAIQEARNQSSTPGLLPRNLTAGTVVPKYADSLAKWKAKYGAEDEMPAASGYASPPPEPAPAAPGTGSGTGGTGTPFPTAPPRKPGDPPGEAGGPENYGPAPGQYPTYKDYPSGTTVQTNPDGTRVGSGSWADNQPSAFQQGLDRSPFGSEGAFDDGLGAFFDRATLAPRLSIQAGIKGAKAGTSKTKKWWQKAKDRFFEDGGVNIPGGPAIVGEKGPEIYWDGIKMHVVGKNGPEQIMIAEGGSIIPMSEAMAMQGIQKGMSAPANSGDAMSRQNDPEVSAKAMAAAQSAISAALAMNPPSTPVPIDGSKDYFSNWRELSGVPYDPMAAPQGGAPRG